MLRKFLRNNPAALFAAILFYLYFRGIGDHGLIDPVEGVNASVGVHMSAGGNYFVPKIGEALTSGSTLGTWWLYALSLKVFGWGEFAVRFWSALSGLGMAWASSIAAGSAGRKSRLAACVCAGMTLCFAVSQIASSHALYSCLMGLAMAGAVRSWEKKNSLILAHTAITLAFIVHGFEGVILPFTAVIVYCVLCDDREFLRNFFTWPGGVLITVIFSGLYFVVLMIANPEIIHFMRCQKHMYTFGGVSGIIIFVFASFIPFHGFIVRAVYEVMPREFPARKSPELFMFVWAAVFASAALLSGDILSLAACVPALSAMLGVKTDSWLERKNLLSVRYSVMFNMMILVPVMYIVLPFTINKFPVIKASLMSLIPYELAVGLFIFASWYYTKTRQIVKWVRNVPAAALLCLMPLAGVFNLTADVYSVRDIGLKLRDAIKGTDKVIQYSVNYPSMYFYTLRNSSIIEADFTEGVQERKFNAPYSLIGSLWAGKERVFLIMPNDKTPENPLPQSVFHLLEADGKLLLSNQ